MKKILIVVDMQNDFIDGALGTKEAQAIVPNVKNKIREYLERDDIVIYTRDTHYSDYLETLEGKNLPIPHCIQNTHGWEIADGLTYGGSIVVNKNTFGYNNWNYTLYNAGIINYDEVESVELAGLCTDICLISNAMILKAELYNVPFIVDASCCAGVTPESHKNALEAMKMCQINVIGE